MLKDYFEVPNKPAIKSGNILSCDFTDHETFIPQPLDYSRGTIATYVDCNGLIKMSGISDTELVTNGDFATDSDWTKEAGWTISEGTANFSGGTGNRAMYQAVGITNGKTYKIQYKVSSISSGQVAVRFGGMSGVGEITATTIGIYTGYITATGSANGNIYIEDNDNNFVGSIDNVSVKEVDVETPRIDYTTEIGKAKELQKPSLLLEPQSTNRITFSEDLSNNWTTANTTVTTNQITSPDGTLTADLLQGTSTSSCIIEPSGLSLTTGVTYTYSVFVKKGNNRWIRLGHIQSSVTGCWFDLDNGVVGTVNSESATIEEFGNNWYRITNTFVATSTTTNNSAFIGICNDNGSTNAGVIGQNVYIWGAMVEQQAFATSYIPTSGSTVTRNQDLASNAGQLGVFNDEEGVLYAEIAALADDSTFRSISINADSTRNDQIMIRYRTNSNIINFFIRDGGSVTFNNNVTVQDITEYHKVALKYKNGDIACWVDGEEKIISTATGMPSGLSRLGFVLEGASVDPFVGKVREVKVFRRALTDSELQELTNNIV